MKEAPNSPYAKLIFRETFRDEQSVRRNGGTPTNVTFSNGVGSFNRVNSKINYKLHLNGTYSVRIRCNPTSFVANQYLFDVRGSDAKGVGRFFISANTGLVNTSSGTVYVNGIVTNSTIFSNNNEIVIAGIDLIEGSGLNRSLIGLNQANGDGLLGTIDLFEIYQGTLTASEVANLHNNTWNKEQSFGGEPKSNSLRNPTFEGSGYPWVAQTTWSFADNKATSVGGSTFKYISQNLSISAGKTYKVTYEVLERTSGTLALSSSSFGNLVTLDSTIGVHSVNVTSTIDYITLFIGYTASPFIGSFSNVYCQELNPKTLLDLDSTQGILSDRAGNTLTPTDVSIKKIGQSYSADFDGANSAITLGSSIINDKAITFTGWVNLRSLGEGISSNSGYILNDTNIKLFLNSSSSRFGLSSNNFSTNAYAANNSIEFNKWIFLSFTRTSAGVVNFYIGSKDNAPALSGTADQASGTPTTSATATIIGNISASGSRTTDGKISECKISEGILDLQTITQIWSESRKNYI